MDYFDFFNKLNWIDYINKSYINLYAPPIKVFKLDKVNTHKTDIYGEEQGARIYLKPFEIKAFHLDNTWRQILGPIPYSEEEESIQVILNFNNMVQTIRELKNKTISEMYISYSGTEIPYAENLNYSFKLFKNDNEVANFDLNTITTVKKLVDEINQVQGFNAQLEGNDSSKNLIQFKKTSFKNFKLRCYSPDDTYQNASDVIEIGDLILTNKWRLYEVASAMPGGDFGWDYYTWVLTCNLAKPAQASLPQEYMEEIKKHQWGIGDKVNIE